MGDNVHGVFVSQKINKVRWNPEFGTDAETFVTGSWDNEDNRLIFWYYPLTCDPQEDDYLDVYPKTLYEKQHEGDVTELKFVTFNKFLVSSSLGKVQLFDILDLNQAVSPKFREVITWDSCHYFKTGEPSSCTGIATFEEDVATIGDDGRINLLSLHNERLVRVIDEADTSSLRCACFLKHNELLTGNLRGHMKVWDLRSSDDKPESTFMLSGEQIGATCVTHHPTQRHLVLAGGEDGALTVWDLRHNTFPVTLLSAHSQTVSELQFHPDRPEHLFTSSTNGEIWQWNTSSVARSSVLGSASDMSVMAGAEDNPWLNPDAAKHRMEVFALMPGISQPINTFDLNRSHLVCGCDNEALYVIKNLIL